MATKDDFLKDLEQAKKLSTQLTLDFSDRGKLVEAEESTARLDARIRGSLQQMAVEVDSLLRGMKQYEREPERYKMSKKEFERRKELSGLLESQLTAFDKQFQEFYQAPASKPNIDFKGTAGAETQETRNMSNKQLRDAQKQMVRQQGDIEDAIVGTSENLVVAARNIGDEVDLHNQLLDKTTGNVDRTETRMEKTNYRMKQLIYNSSDCCLGLTIAGLIVCLVLIIILL